MYFRDIYRVSWKYGFEFRYLVRIGVIRDGFLDKGIVEFGVKGCVGKFR